MGIFDLSAGGPVLGCHNCLAIFSYPEFHYLDSQYDSEWRCPNCGSPAVELGELPIVTEKRGAYYLTDGARMLGPYNDPEAAQADLWAWFGGEHAPRKVG